MIVRRLRPLPTVWLMAALGLIGLAVVLAGGQACPPARTTASPIAPSPMSPMSAMSPSGEISQMVRKGHRRLVSIIVREW